MERLNSHETKNAPRNTELERAGAERLRQIERSAEHPEHSRKHEAVESAREQLSKVEEAPAAAEHQVAPRPISPSGLSRRISYEHTMKSLQRKLSPASRAFSKTIHAPAVEAMSEAAGKTVLRPSVTLGATTTAILIELFLYLSARQYGFQLRGGELWLALLLGGVIGLFIEGIIRTIRGMNTRIE